MVIVDIADQPGTVPYKMATQADLAETVKLVEAYNKRALAIKADVRSKSSSTRRSRRASPSSASSTF